jgi:hypothetical protein
LLYTANARERISQLRKFEVGIGKLVMRIVSAFAIAATLAAVVPAHAGISVHIDKSSQSMTVSVDGGPRYRWPISTGRSGYDTPGGSFSAIRLERVYYSKKYDDAPMPNSVFFHGGYAIHGTYEQSKLGRPVSHGCVRLSRANAATLFELVRAHGMHNTSITIGGSIDGSYRGAINYPQIGDAPPRYRRYDPYYERPTFRRGRYDDYGDVVYDDGRGFRR